jgi:CheY-like chemotaxis protein
MRPIKLLLVEDNEGDILLMTEALEEGTVSYELITLKDGATAIDFLQRRQVLPETILPDLILLDINLPRRNGIEVLQFIKSSEHLRHIPVIMLTTSSNSSDIANSYDNYVNCYITKPEDITEFMHVMQTIETFWMKIVQLPGLT